MVNAEVVFEELQLHAIPLESATLSSDRVLQFSADLANEERMTLIFTGVVGLRCEDTMMQEMFHRDVNAPRYDTLLRVLNSNWLREIRTSYQQEGHRLSEETEHFVLCFQDYTWEVLARDCRIDDKNC